MRSVVVVQQQSAVAYRDRCTLGNYVDANISPYEKEVWLALLDE